MTHLSVRLAWHDSGWNGKICASPRTNVYCMVHKYIREHRDDAFEEDHSTSPLDGLHRDHLPPCVRDTAAFSPSGYEMMHEDPVDWRGLPPTREKLPGYSVSTAPYGRMLSSEPGKTWVDNPEEQLPLLEDFWGTLEQGKSLVFFYVNQGNPLSEDESDRILVGIGRVKKLGPQLYFGKNEKYPEDHPIWERRVTHNFPEEGVRLPYQEYVAQGLDPSSITCTIPATVRPLFSYVSEHVSDDIAVGILERAIGALRAVIADGHVEEPHGMNWEYRLDWLNQVLAEVWRGRGRFPGTGGMLEYLGFRNAVAYHKTVLTPMENEGQNVLEYVLSILEDREDPPDEYSRSFAPAIRRWGSVPPSRHELLKMLAHFELGVDQIRRVCNPQQRREAEIEATEEEILENPYVLSELDRGGVTGSGGASPPIDFETIDRGMIPGTAVPVEGVLDEVAQDDDRRVRALLVDVLRRAAQRGDTCLVLDDAVKAAAEAVPEERICLPDLELIIYNRSFFEERLSFYPDEEPSLVALRPLRRIEEEVGLRVRELLAGEHPSIPEDFWKDLIEEEFKGKEVPDEEIETKAREEKAEILRRLSTLRFAVLTGSAGTGKTTVLKLLIEGLTRQLRRQSVLLLAPTGKARVRLEEITKSKAQTIHQFLMRLGWIRTDPFSLRSEGGRQQGAPIVVVDEASMVPMDLLGTLFRAIDFNEVQRLVLVGDPNQLPPIGPGRPFVDILRWLEDEEDRSTRVCRLAQRVRFEDATSQALKLADGFAGDNPSAGDDEMVSRVARGEVSGDLAVAFWTDRAEFFELLDHVLRQELHLGSRSGPDPSGFDEAARNPEGWQILSPTRREYFGTSEVNRIMQRTYRGHAIKEAHTRKLPPFGSQQIVEGDKVIQVVNSWRPAIKNGEKPDGYVANGEVGYVEHTYKRGTWAGRGRVLRTPDTVSVRFSTQPMLTYRYPRGEVDSNLELAYALTVHKAQGSDFDKVILVLPQTAATMSRELLYTALTRFKKKVVLLLERDVSPLLTFRNPQYSEVLRRHTNLFGPAVPSEAFQTIYPQALIHRTISGTLVRSKSEVIVANILQDLGLSYRYEEPLYSSEDSRDFRLPDFTILYKGKTYYLEHLGRLGDPVYRRDWQRKKRWYKENDYWDSLIVTEDGPDGRVDSQETERLVREHVLGES